MFLTIVQIKIKYFLLMKNTVIREMITPSPTPKLLLFFHAAANIRIGRSYNNNVNIEQCEAAMTDYITHVRR